MDPHDLLNPTGLGWTAAIAAVVTVFTALGWIAGIREGLRGVSGLESVQENPLLMKARDAGTLLCPAQPWWSAPVFRWCSGRQPDGSSNGSAWLAPWPALLPGRPHGCSTGPQLGDGGDHVPLRRPPETSPPSVRGRNSAGRYRDHHPPDFQHRAAGECRTELHSGLIRHHHWVFPSGSTWSARSTWSPGRGRPSGKRMPARKSTPAGPRITAPFDARVPRKGTPEVSQRPN